MAIEIAEIKSSRRTPMIVQSHSIRLLSFYGGVLDGPCLDVSIGSALTSKHTGLTKEDAILLRNSINFWLKSRFPDE